jgi:hypothetical protein
MGVERRLHPSAVKGFVAVVKDSLQVDARALRCVAERVVSQRRLQISHSELARMIESERAPTNMRLNAHVASRLSQLRDTNLRPR